MSRELVRVKRLDYDRRIFTIMSDSRMIRTLNSKGFTLIESIITIVIVGIISSIAALIILEGMKASSKEQNFSEAHYQARIALERMSREIKLIRWNTALAQADITTMTPTDLRYTDIQGNQMGFRLNAINIQRTQDNSATWQTLATGVIALNFSYLQQDGVTIATPANIWFVDITMTSQPGTDSLLMRTRVHLRNF
jgi:prepilin-type N-terminal cleavage/methylation domain-containing protein